jgi:hypothetical protein
MIVLSKGLITGRDTAKPQMAKSDVTDSVSIAKILQLNKKPDELSDVS